MPTYRIRRADREDQMIEAHSMEDNGTFYVFYDDDKYVITVVPKDAVDVRPESWTELTP